MLLYPAINELNKKTDSRYTLVILAAKRARDLIANKPVLTDFKAERPVTLAAYEISEDLITYKRREEKEPEETDQADAAEAKTAESEAETADAAEAGESADEAVDDAEGVEAVESAEEVPAEEAAHTEEV